MLADGIFGCRFTEQIVENRVSFCQGDILRPQASHLPDKILQITDILILVGEVLRPTVGENIRGTLGLISILSQSKIANVGGRKVV
jgi:hypothetical protein